jgi:branched-chain amino acid transport system permease protein
VTAPAFAVERRTLASRVGAAAGAAVPLGLATLPWWGSASLMRLLVEFISLLVLAQMWNLLAGYAGLVSIGQQAYIGLGGYALIVLADDLGVNPFVAVFLAGLVAAAFAVPTAALVFRFRGGTSPSEPGRWPRCTDCSSPTPRISAAARAGRWPRSSRWRGTRARC